MNKLKSSFLSLSLSKEELKSIRGAQYADIEISSCGGGCYGDGWCHGGCGMCYGNGVRPGICVTSVIG